MMFMAYFDDDIKSMLINIVLGIAAGYISFRLNYALLGLVVAVVVYAAGSLLTKKLLKLKKERKWWLSGTFVFFLSWIISWTVLYNL